MSPNHPEGTPEVANDNKKINYDNLYAKAYKRYVSSKLSTEGEWFITRIQSLPDTDTSYKDDFMQFINDEASNDPEFFQIWEDFKDKMSLGKIKSLLFSQFSRLKNRRNSAKKFFLQRYDVTPSYYDTNIASKIEGLTSTDLEDFYRSSENTAYYLQEWGLELPARRDIKKFLDSFHLENKLAKLSPEKREEIQYMLEMDIQSFHISSPQFPQKIEELMQMLFGYNVFSPAEKKDILSHLSPTISLQKAQRLKLISNREIENYLKKEYLEGLSGAQRDEALEKLKHELQNIEVSVADLNLSKEADLDSFTHSVGFASFAQELQDFYHINRDGAIQDFGDLLHKISTSKDVSVTHPEYFLKGNILELNVEREWVVLKEYYAIISTQGEWANKNRLVLQNKGWGGIYTPNKNSRVELYEYGEFLWILESKRTTDVEFHERKSFQQKVRDGIITESSDSYEFLSKADKESQWLEGQEDINSSNLKSKIDNLDGAGREFWLEKGTTFQTPDTNDLYTIESINEWALPAGEITISNIGGKKETINFEQFFSTFQERKATRKSRVNSGEELVSVAGWSGAKFEGGKLINVWYKDKAHQNTEYLVAGDANDTFWKEYNMLKLHSIDGDRATISFWKTEKTKEKWKKNFQQNTIYKETKEKISVSLAMLQAWNSYASLTPKNLDGENIQEDMPKGTDERKWGPWSYYVNTFMSVSGIISAGKMWTDNMKSYFDDGSNEQAMKLAYKIPVFTSEQRTSMTMRLEQAEKKAAEEATELLWVLDSTQAVQQIVDWLLDKNTPEAKKEGALIYMLEKYGILYEKWPIMAYQGKFLWYEALGGTIGDETYREYEAECREEKIQFTEEKLVYKLVAQQCKGYRKPKRRGKLYKQVEQVMAKWLKEDLEKGTADADKKGTYHAKEKFAMDELWGGAYNVAMGAMESLLNKWADRGIPQLNALPFVMMTSWAANYFDTSLTNKFKANSLILSQFFTAKQSTIDLYNKTVQHLCKDIGEKLWGKYENMSQEFQEVLNWDSEKVQADRVEKAWKFYSKYEDILGRALLGLNTRKQDREAEFETWIRFHADDNPVYAEYIQTFDVAMLNVKDPNFQNEDRLKDAYASNNTPGTWGITGIWVEDFASKYLTPQTWGVGFRHPDLGEMYWNEFISQIDSLAQNSNLDELYKRERIWYILTWIMNGLSRSYAQRNDEIDMIRKNPAATFYTKFHEWDVQASDFALGGWKFDTTEKGKQMIEKYVNNILSYSSIKSSDRNYSLKWIDKITTDTQKRTANNLNSNPFEGS